MRARVSKSSKSLSSLHGVFLQGHYVVRLGVRYSHSLLRLTPTDQAAWLRRRPADFKPNRDQFGNHFATIGAGPSNPFRGRLVKGINRSYDVADPPWFSIRLDVATEEENAVIRRLFALYGNYRDDLNYEFIPHPGWYNSNSFISGFLDAAGLSKPGQITDDSLLGWDLPVPVGEFGVP